MKRRLTALHRIATLAASLLASRGPAVAQTPPAPPIAPAVVAPAPDRIVVIITGLRSDNGLVGVALYAQNSRWPEPHGFMADCDARIVNRVGTCVLTGIRPGSYYAIAVTHDENRNGRFDQGFLGIPLEGYGFSRDARPFLSAPSFDACKFLYRGGEMPVRIRMQY
jgi:uncharacterized protein (DUF2141 family)